MSDETWEKRELDRPDRVSRLVVSANQGRDGCEVTLPTWIVDRILCFEALAGLAGEMRAMLHGAANALDLSIWCRDYDALTQDIAPR